MPNWCSNTLTVRGSNQKEINDMVEAFKESRFCDSIIPTPEDLNREGSSSHGGENAKLYDDIRAENRAKHGYDNWYDFQVARWGTKWDVGGDDAMIELDDDGLGFTASFDSAWSPPMGVVEELVSRGLSVTLYYYEPGMGYVGKYEDGYDDYFDYSGYTSDNIRDLIGEELDDHWAISENMAQWEAENEQDELEEFLEEGAKARGLTAPDPIKF